ncbi:FecR family protein, partial [Acinetobacter sp.]
MLCLSVGAAGYIAHNSAVFSYYTADLKTDTGEMQSFILEDGSKITLGAKSAINLDFKSEKRQINLVQGDLYIDVAKDQNRPLIIHTPQADFKALGTRFIVHQYASSSTLSMLHSKVETRSSSASHALKVVQQGETLTADAQGLSEISALSIPSAELAWQKQQILADNLPLPDLLTRLGRYHHQYLVFNHSALSHYKVSGVINAQQDLDKTLSLLLVQHPQLKIRKISSHVIAITANE